MEYFSKNSSYCFWDKHPFDGKGVMCPIFYKPRQIVRQKGEYYINQNICRSQVVEENVLTLKEEIFYDEMFCSAECCFAWIEDNSMNHKYKNSKYIMQNEMMKTNPDFTVKAANHWRTLNAFGGFFSIEDFRKHQNIFKKIDYFYEENCLKEIYKEVCDIE